MSESHLITHCGARTVDREQLECRAHPGVHQNLVPDRAHLKVLETVEQKLREGGFCIERERLALSRNDARFFGTLDLGSVVASGVTLAVEVRNSVDKSLPIGFAAGRVFVCDNLAFRSEITVARKHTRFGDARYGEALSRAVQGLAQFQEAEGARIKRFRLTDLSNVEAESLMLRAYEKDVVSHRLLPRVIKGWREPSFEEFQPRTLWSLLNAFTAALAERQATNPQQFASLTIRLNDLLSEAAGVRPDEQVPTLTAEDGMAPEIVRGRCRANRGSFRPVGVAGPDPRRHVFTQEERSRGGRTTAQRYLCTGRWHLDWWDRCDRRTRNDEGGYDDGEEEGDAGGRGDRPAGGGPAGPDPAGGRGDRR